MSVEDTIEIATGAIEKALDSHQLSDAEKDEIKQILSKAMVKTIKKTTHNQVDAALNCCGPEQDLAHQLSEEMHRKKNLLISNLMALR